MGKSPLMKKLVGNQHRLPEKLKQFIKDAPGKLMKKPSPNKQSVRADTRKRELEKRKNQNVTEEKPFVPNIRAQKGDVLKRSQGQLAKGAGGTEGAGSGKQAKIKGSSGIDNLKRIASGGATKSETDSVKKMTSQLTPRKPKVSVAELKRRKSIQPPPSVQAKGKGTIKPPETIKRVSTKPKSDFGKKVINRGTSFTDEFGTTYTRDVKGRKKADGSVSKTVTNKRDGVNVSQRDVTKGPKVKGQRRARTVTRTKFDTKGDVRKVVTKTRGQKRKVLSDADAEKKTEELKKRRDEREKSPTKLMKNKTPNKMMKKSPTKKMHKGGMKMMKKSPTMMMKKKSSMKMMKKKK